jgi:SAM-dependent methyltransferase
MGDGPLLHRVRERIRPLVPRQLQVAANRAVFSVVALVLRGNAVRCPCCGHSYRRFSRYPTEYCPACGSYERQRLLCLYLDRNPTLLAGDVLQVGPERSIKDRYKPRARRWLAVDAEPAHPLADETMDVRSLALPDEAFDFVLCSHVLDIVEEHDEAVAELHRVTRLGGTVLIQAPWRSVKGMPDVYAKRLERAGFRVTPQLLEEQTDEVVRRRFGLDSDDPLFVCRR